MASKKKVKTKQKQKLKQKQSQTVIVNVSKITRAKPTKRQLQNKPIASSPIFQPVFQPTIQPVFQPSIQPSIQTYKLGEEPKPLKFETGIQTDLQLAKELAEQEYFVLDKNQPSIKKYFPVSGNTQTSGKSRTTQEPIYSENEPLPVDETATLQGAFRQFRSPAPPMEAEPEDIPDLADSTGQIVVKTPKKSEREKLLQRYSRVFGGEYVGGKISNKELKKIIQEEEAIIKERKFEEQALQSKPKRKYTRRK
jgi:hypothetical protein